MRRRLLPLGLLAALPLLAAPQVEAQSVRADVWIGTGPVFGRIRLGDDPYDRYVLRRRYERERVVIVEPRVIVVERIRPRGRGWSWNAYRKFRRDARVVVIYFDSRHDRWYDRPYRRGLHEVRVYERGGRYFWIDADDRAWDRDYYDRYNNRYNDRYNDRYDDRYDDRRYRRGDDDDWERDWERDDDRRDRDRERSRPRR
ncbi:MAG: hypothetical protein ACRENB_00460 [Gemmatimonadales bacterium]